MTVKTAMITDFFFITPETSVKEGLKMLHDKKVRIVPVVDEEKNYYGLFCYRTLLGKLLPLSATMESGLENLEFTSQSNAEVSEKLEELLPEAVSNVMDTERPTLTPTTSFWHMLLMVYKYDAPLAVLDPETQKIVGVVSKQSSMEDLKRRLPDL